MAKKRKHITAARAPHPELPTFVLRPEPLEARVTPQALHDLARQLGLDHDDRFAVRVVGEELHITLTPLALADGTLAAEAVDAAVCMPDEGWSYFPDDVHTACGECGTPIRHRPSVPSRPKKVCLDCGTRPTAAAEGGEG